MTRSLYDPSNPKHKAVCQRAACEGSPEHPGGRHLDQRDELYSGPGLSVDGLPLSVRDSAKKILQEAPALMPELVDLANEVNWLRRQLAHVSVEKDHAVRDAMRRSESCEHHGEEIKELGKALYAADQRERRTEAARLAMLSFYQSVKDAVDAYQGGRVRTEPTLKAFMGTLGAFVKRAGAAHDRAWKS